jgi:hypothetical protein
MEIHLADQRKKITWRPKECKVGCQPRSKAPLPRHPPTEPWKCLKPAEKMGPRKSPQRAVRSQGVLSQLQRTQKVGSLDNQPREYLEGADSADWGRGTF